MPLVIPCNGNLDSSLTNTDHAEIIDPPACHDSTSNGWDVTVLSNRFQQVCNYSSPAAGHPCTGEEVCSEPATVLPCR